MTAEERGGARGEKLSAMCLRSIARVRLLIEDHFLSERLDVGGIPLRPEPLVLHEVFAGCQERRAHDVGELTTDVDPGLVLTADRTLVERALDALIAFAGGEATPVRIAARRHGEAVELEISGRPAVDGALADPTKGSASDPKGRSLALPLVRRAVETLGGTIAARGGAYVLSIPAAQAYAAPPKTSAPP